MRRNGLLSSTGHSRLGESHNALLSICEVCGSITTRRVAYGPHADGHYLGTSIADLARQRFEAAPMVAA
jgi:hypothetical protein